MDFLYRVYDADNARRKLERRIWSARTTIKITDAMDKVAHQMKGKKLTKRYAVNLGVELGEEFNVFYVKSYGMVHLYIHNEYLYDTKTSILIAYENDEDDMVIDPEIIKKRAMAHYKDKERLHKLESARVYIDNLVERVKKAQDEVKSALRDAREYGIEYMLHIER